MRWNFKVKTIADAKIVCLVQVQRQRLVMSWLLLVAHRDNIFVLDVKGFYSFCRDDLNQFQAMFAIDTE